MHKRNTCNFHGKQKHKIQSFPFAYVFIFSYAITRHGRIKIPTQMDAKDDHSIQDIKLGDDVRDLSFV